MSGLKVAQDHELAELVTVVEAAAMLGMGRSTFHRDRDELGLHPVRKRGQGGKYLFRREDVAAAARLLCEPIPGQKQSYVRRSQAA